MADVPPPQVLALICGYADDKRKRVAECAKLIDPFFKRHGVRGGVEVYADDGVHPPPTKAVSLNALLRLVRGAAAGQRVYVVVVGCAGDESSAFLPSDFRTAGYLTHADVLSTVGQLRPGAELVVLADLVDGGSFVQLPYRLSAEKSPLGTEPPRMLLRLDTPAAPPVNLPRGISAVATTKGGKLPTTIGTFFKAFVAIVDLNPEPMKQQLLADLWHVLSKSCGTDGPMPRLLSSIEISTGTPFVLRPPGGVSADGGSPTRVSPPRPLVQPTPAQRQPTPIQPPSAPHGGRGSPHPDGLQAFASQHMPPPLRPSPAVRPQASPPRSAKPSPPPTATLSAAPVQPPHPAPDRAASRSANVLRVPEPDEAKNQPPREAIEPLQGTWVTSSMTEVIVDGARALFVESGHTFPVTQGAEGLELMGSKLLGNPVGQPVRLVWDDGDVWAKRGANIPPLSPVGSPAASPQMSPQVINARLKHNPFLTNTVITLVAARVAKDLLRRRYTMWTTFVLLARQFRRTINIGRAQEGRWRVWFAGQFFRKWRLWLVLRRPTTLPYRFRPVKSRRVGEPDRVALWIKKAVVARQTENATAAQLYDALRSVPSEDFWARVKDEYLQKFAGRGVEEDLRANFAPQELEQCRVLMLSFGVSLFPTPPTTPPMEGL